MTNFRVGMGGNGLGQQTMNQYYLLFGLWALNEVDIQRVVGHLTGYDVTVESGLGADFEYGFVGFFKGVWGFLETSLFLPLTVTVRTVTVKY